MEKKDYYYIGYILEKNKPDHKKAVSEIRKYVVKNKIEPLSIPLTLMLLDKNDIIISNTIKYINSNIKL